MFYYSKQLNNERWGIFIKNELVATIGCPVTCNTIIQSLEARLSQSEIPAGSTMTIIRYFRDLKLAS